MSKGPSEADVIAAAQQAIGFARQHFQLTLDYSDKSIQGVESILARFYDDLPKGVFQRMFRPAPSAEKISQTVVEFGSYVGEALRRRLTGSRWEKDTSSGQSVLCLTDGERKIWPHAKVHKRIVNGPEDTSGTTSKASLSTGTKTTNLAHALDGGIPRLFNVQRHRPAASDEQRWPL